MALTKVSNSMIQGAPVNVLDFGAVGDGVTDDTAAIQAAITSLAPLGGTVYFPKGTYIVEDTTAAGYCLQITSGTNLVGDGPAYTVIRPSDNNPLTSNILYFNPDGNYDNTGAGVENLFIGNTNDGTLTGLHAVYCYTNSSTQFLPKFHINRINVGAGTGVNGRAVYHYNNPANNIQGGMYGALIENSLLRNGIRLEKSGDSNVIRDNIISAGTIGIYVTPITGASLLSILDNNITNAGGAIRVENALRTHILRNNIENLEAGAASSNAGAVIYIENPSSTGVAGVIGQNLISVFGTSDATKHVSISNQRGMHIEDNTFLAGIGGLTAVTLDATCTDVRVGANSYNAAVATKLANSGIGTMGAILTPTLLNSWVENSTSETPTYTKGADGIVYLSGAIKSGTATASTTLMTLPLGFRPPTGKLLRFGVYSLGGTTTGVGRVELDEAGTLTINDGGNTLLCLSGIAFATKDFADSLSPE